MKSLVLSLVAFTFVAAGLASTANAARIENDGRYVYYITPWTDMFRDAGQTEFIFQAGYNVLKDYLRQLSGLKMLPSEITNDEDMKNFEAGNDKLNSMLDKLNLSLNGLRSHSSFSALDAVPTAAMVYVGGKFTVDIKIGGGGSASFGVVIMPVRIQTVDKLTNKVVGDPEYTVRFAPIVTVAPEIGTSATAGVKSSRFRWGGGFIWSRTMSVPTQFQGYGGAGSKTFLVGTRGVNVKFGALKNAELKDWLDTVYATFGVENGLGVGQDLHFAGTWVLPLSKVIELLTPTSTPGAGSSSPVVMQAFENKFSQAVKKQTLEMQNALMPIQKNADQAKEETPPLVPKDGSPNEKKDWE